LVTTDVRIAIELQFARARTRLEVEFVELDPKDARAVGVLEVIDLVLLIADGEPQRVGDVGLPWNLSS
jgi:hypothetical protein